MCRVLIRSVRAQPKKLLHGILSVSAAHAASLWCATHCVWDAISRLSCKLRNLRQTSPSASTFSMRPKKRAFGMTLPDFPKNSDFRSFPVPQNTAAALISLCRRRQIYANPPKKINRHIPSIMPSFRNRSKMPSVRFPRALKRKNRVCRPVLPPKNTSAAIPK